MSVTQLLNLYNQVGYPLGTAAPTTPGWTAEHIVYYRLTLDSAYSPYGLFQYDRILSGRYDGSGQILEGEVQQFIQTIQNKSQSVTRRLTEKEIAPHIRAIRRCYVVLELDPSLDWYFLPGAHAIRTVNDCGAKFVNFRYVKISDTTATSPGTMPPRGAPHSDPGPIEKSRIVYFAVENPFIISTESANFFTQLNAGTGGLIPLILDPDIKNDGGDSD